jgi:RimJ/RimL family protein N-acetyltransferase
VPRRLSGAALTPPDPPLADDLIRLEPLTGKHVAAFVEIVQDEDIQRYTYVPSEPDKAFVRGWIGRYEDAWKTGGRAGFAAVGHDGEVLGFAAIVHLDLGAREGEIGYAIALQARGRGVASRAVSLLTRWGFDELDLLRLELRIDVDNAGSERVAERAGYQREGVLRSKHFKEGLRSDVGIWSRLRGLQGAE